MGYPDLGTLVVEALKAGGKARKDDDPDAEVDKVLEQVRALDAPSVRTHQLPRSCARSQDSRTCTTWMANVSPVRISNSLPELTTTHSCLLLQESTLLDPLCCRALRLPQPTALPRTRHIQPPNLQRQRDPLNARAPWNHRLVRVGPSTPLSQRPVKGDDRHAPRCTARR